MWDPEAGCVRLGGVDLRALALADVRSCSAWAAQLAAALAQVGRARPRRRRPGGARLLEVISRQDRTVLLVTHSPELLGPGWRVLDLAESTVAA